MTFTILLIEVNVGFTFLEMDRTTTT